MPHTHKYKRVKIGRKKDYVVYACQLNCSHYVTPEFIVGRVTICFRCGKEFELTKSLLKVKPTCKDCIKNKIKKTEPKATDAIFKVLGI